MLFAKIVLSVTILIANQSFAARILGLFPVPSISHQVVFRQLTYELAKRGHELVVITPDPAFYKDEIGRNITEIDVHDLSYNLWRQKFITHIRRETSPYKLFGMIFRLLPEIVEAQMQHVDVQDMIRRKEKFDLILTEACVRTALVTSHIFKAPVIQVSSLGSIYPNLNVIGAPSYPILYPEMMSPTKHNMTLWEKIENLWFDIKIRRTVHLIEEKENVILKRIAGRDTPTVPELEKNVAMLFVYSYPLWDGNRPIPPGLVYIGGMYKRQKQVLSNETAAFLDSSTHGVIYMSFGTNVPTSSLPPAIVQVFMRVFAKLPYDILMKWDSSEIVGKPDNVKLFKWMPQPDLLKHPKVKLFVNQAGLQSTEEAIDAAVPMVSFPMLADQWYNAEKYVEFGIGTKHDISTITEEELENAIKTVIKDQSYKENMKKLRAVILDQKETPAERAVYWVENVLRHGGRHLRTKLSDVTWTEFLVLDVVAVLLVTFLLCLSVLFYIVKFLISMTIHNEVKLKTT